MLNFPDNPVKRGGALSYTLRDKIPEDLETIT